MQRSRSHFCLGAGVLAVFLLRMSLAPVLAAASEHPRQIGSGENAIAVINAAAPGEILLLSPGRYQGGTITRGGITIRRTGEGKAVFCRGVKLQADGVLLDGLTWEDLSGTNLEICGRDNVVRNCEFRRFGQQQPAKAIWIRETGDYGGNRVEDCLFEDWGGTTYHSSCIKIGQTGFPNAHQGTIVRGNTLRRGSVGGNKLAIQPFCPTLIENNTIHDCEDGVETKGSRMIVRNNTIFRCFGVEAMSNRSGLDNLLEGNLLYDCPRYAWQIWTGRRNVWRNNVVVGCGQIAIIKGGDTAAHIAADDLLINNTFVNNRRGISWDLKQFPPQRIRFFNNLFVGNGSAAIEPLGKGLYQEDYNLYFGYRAPTPLGTHSIDGKNPLFIDMERRDFHLLPSNAAINAGLGAGRDVPAFDRDGTRRPQGLGVDMGAYEWRAQSDGADRVPNGRRP